MAGEQTKTFMAAGTIAKRPATDSPEVEAATRAARLAEKHRRFLEFLRARVGDAAEDILQSAYVKAMEHGAELRADDSSVAWFYRILRNAVVDHYRRTAARARALEQATAGWTEGYEPELKREVCACIREVIDDLKPEYRVAIEQVDLAGESVESFAHAARTTANNAAVRLHRARRAVARRLTEVCGTCDVDQYLDCGCGKKQSTGF